MKSIQRTITPVDGSVYLTRQLASGQAIEKALGRATKAQQSWKQVPIAERAAICRRMAEWCVAKAEELATELSWQMGRPVSQTPGELKRGFHERALYMCSQAKARSPNCRSIPRRVSSASSGVSRSAWCWSSPPGITHG